MSSIDGSIIVTLTAVCMAASICAQTLSVNDTPAKPGEWGFRPRDGEETPVTPPGLVWRPQKRQVMYELECSRDSKFANVDYRAEGRGGTRGFNSFEKVTHCH